MEAALDRFQGRSVFERARRHAKVCDRCCRHASVIARGDLREHSVLAEWPGAMLGIRAWRRNLAGVGENRG
ncbi:MAG TPA: hypothetical protein DHW63_03605 [Hyphomonadaceae bacterium]|nr:hypothetical protein [Hyphomonadaceae bacterium]